MEVHHHPDLHHQPKPWKEYLLEFVMIFLAVTLGFFAESLRETIAEHAKEKQNMRSLVADLQMDTAMLHSAITKACPARIRQSDSLLSWLYSDHPEANSNNIYRVTASLRRRFFHGFQDNTMTELRNSGDQRLISNKGVLDSISYYYGAVAIINAFDNNIQETNDRMNALLPQIFNNKDWVRQFATVTDDMVFVRDPLTLRSTDAGLMNQLAFYISEFRANEAQFMKRANRLQEHAGNIISFIKSEYDLE